jgi:xylan 1,4-beta-xylosidase
MSSLVKYPNPLIPGFNPDPSIVKVGDDYYLATSTFEYLPGIPVYHSKDLIHWELIGHVATRTEQVGPNAPTNLGIWAPTIRYRDGNFYVVVTDAMGRGTLIFTATNPAGPWSDGIVTDIQGIDPDLAWDENGTPYMTFSGLILDGEEIGTHLGIQQARIDLETGKLLEEVRSIWSGVGGMFPEAPHLYKIGEYWYLMIAEGGTERGHAVSVARATHIEGPFEAAPHTPILTARGTIRPVQNTGHADLFQTPDGGWAMVLLGVRTRGMTRQFSSLGRETFISEITWKDGWPHAEPVHLNDILEPPVFHDDFTSEELNLEWISLRQLPTDVAKRDIDGVVLTANGQGLGDINPAWIGRRQRRLDGIVYADMTVNGAGGISLRYDEVAHYDLELRDGQLLARFNVSSIVHEVVAVGFDATAASQASGSIRLYMEFKPAGQAFTPEGQSSDFIGLGWVDLDGVRHEVASFDGRFLSNEVTTSFTGRVVGVYCVAGQVRLHEYQEVAR